MVFFNNTYTLYELISKHKECGIYTIKKVFGWSERKVKRYIKKLLKGGLIVKVWDRVYRAKTVKELINWNEMK